MRPFRFRDYANRDTQYAASIWHTKAITIEEGLNCFNLCLKYAAALDFDLQTTTKAQALLVHSTLFHRGWRFL